MLSRQKPLAALAAVTAAAAIAAPAASASAATTAAPSVDPTVCQLLNTTRGPFGPTQLIIGGASLASVLANAGNSVGCAPPAPQPSLLPTASWLQ
jgi:type IV secretory pathway VirB2 component (pilin)